MREQTAEEAAIESEIARIRSLPGDALRRRWRTAFGRIPPTALSKDLLARMITRQIQEQAFGGLDRDSLDFWMGWRARAVRASDSSNPAPCSFAVTRAA